MVARRISPGRPAALARLIAARDRELESLKFEREERGDTCNHRLDLIEFVTFCLLAETCNQSLALGHAREPLLIMLAVLSEKYRHPKILRDVAALVREGGPL